MKQEVVESLLESMLGCAFTASQARRLIDSIVEHTHSDQLRLRVIDEKPFPQFIKLMQDIWCYGLEKYGENSFQAHALKGDTTRFMPRVSTDQILCHMGDHAGAYEKGQLHDHFNTLEHHLAAIAFNAMMEYYFYVNNKIKSEVK